jgi:hypothetical protein
MCRDLEAPLYQFFVTGRTAPVRNQVKRRSSDQAFWGSSGHSRRFLSKPPRKLAKRSVEDRQLVLQRIQKLADRQLGSPFRSNN